MAIRRHANMMRDDDRWSPIKRPHLFEPEDPRTEACAGKKIDLPHIPGGWAFAIVLPAGMALLIVLEKLWFIGQ